MNESKRRCPKRKSGEPAAHALAISAMDIAEDLIAREQSARLARMNARFFDNFIRIGSSPADCRQSRFNLFKGSASLQRFNSQIKRLKPRFVIINDLIERRRLARSF